MFELKYLGHAGWSIVNKDLKIICDPWFSPNGAYYGEWKQFPENLNVLDSSLLNKIDLVYISHIHDDHFDPWFLRQINKQIKILIPRFRDKTLLVKIRELGFSNVLELDRNDAIQIKGIKIKIIEDEGYLDADSCLLLDDGVNKILNLNDCHLDFSKLKELVGDIDLLLLQSSSAIWWPCVYDYDDETKNRLGEIKRNNILNRTVQYSNTLNAKNVIPNAGPPIFINKELEHWNKNRRKKSNPFILMDDAHHHLIENNIKSHLVIPGSTLLLQSEELKNNTNKIELKKIYDDYEKYLKQYQRDMSKITPPFASKLEVNTVVDKFEKQLERIQKISKFYVKKINFPILFDFKDSGKWILDFNQEKCFSKYVNQDYKYYFIIEPRKVALLFQEESVDFERYFLGCNFTCGRVPDEYNEFVFALLKHFDTRRFLISESLYAERANILDEMFSVQKYCPHMFADLEKSGFIDDDDNLVCPLHGWKFNLGKNGECQNNKKFCLKIKYNKDNK